MRFSASPALMILLMATRAWSEPAPHTPCVGPRIQLAPELGARQPWVAAVRAATRRVAQLGEVDHCAVLDVQWTGTRASVRASLPDGRFAFRRVSEPKDLTSTVVALLALPLAWSEGSPNQPTGPANASASAASAAPLPAPAVRASEAPAASSTALSSASAPPSVEVTPSSRFVPVRAVDVTLPPASSLDVAYPSEVTLPFQNQPSADLSSAGSGGTFLSELAGIELGVGARVLGAESNVFGVGASAFASARAGRWLFGLAGHGERLQRSGASNSAPITSASTWGIGLTVGHRLVDGPVTLDLVLVPAEVAFSRATYATQMSTVSSALSDDSGSGSDDGSSSGGSDDHPTPTPTPTTTMPPPAPPPPPQTTTPTLPPPPPPQTGPTLPPPPAPQTNTTTTTTTTTESVTATPATPSAASVSPIPSPSVPASNATATAAPQPNVAGAGAQAVPQEMTSTELRMGATLRASAALSGPFRWYAELNGNLSPLRLAREPQPTDGLALMPRWAAGVSLGVLWSSP